MELHFRYSVAVSEELSFIREAEKLRLAQPSLTGEIRDIGDAPVIPLLARTHDQLLWDFAREGEKEGRDANH